MTLVFEERPSDSPYVERVTRGWTTGDGTAIRPAECHWHMVFTRVNGHVLPIVVGPLTAAGVATFGGEAEILWIKFRLGTWLPHLPARDVRDTEPVLPGASAHSFWLKSASWQFPNYDNVETFVERLVHDDVLVHDPIVDKTLRGHPLDISSRTVRHRFLQATGLTHRHIRQVERAKHAEALLRQGMSILDTVDEAGYFDQPHLTRALRQWIGHTPAEIVRLSAAH